MTGQELRANLARLQSGSIDAFEQLYKELKTPVYTIIFRIVYDRAMAEDLTQEVFLRLFRAPPDERVQNPRAFVFQMARNLGLDSRRKPTQEELNSEIPHPGRSIEEAVELRLDLEKAMRALPGDAREIVTLHLNAGLKFREIAGIFHLPLGTVLWKYQKAIALLRSTLSGGML